MSLEFETLFNFHYALFLLRGMAACIQQSHAMTILDYEGHATRWVEWKLVLRTKFNYFLPCTAHLCVVHRKN